MQIVNEITSGFLRLAVTLLDLTKNREPISGLKVIAEKQKTSDPPVYTYTDADGLARDSRRQKQPTIVLSEPYANVAFG